MSQIVYFGSTIRLTSDFQAWSTAATPVLQDPVTVTGQILDQNNNVLYSTIPTRQSIGTYYFDWTPVAPGTFIANFLGVFADNSQSENSIVLEVVPIGRELGVVNNLEDDIYVEFYMNVTPLYIDPFSVSTLFPDAPIGEIIELVYQYSQEANEITGIANLASADFPPDGMSWTVQAPYPSVTPFVREFVQANVMCALTRIYDIGQGADDLQIMLADLQVTRRSTIKDKVTRVNATTWCELAQVLREELYRTTKFSGMRSVIRGDKVGANPMPNRHVKHQEWVGWRAGRSWNRGNKFDSGYFN